MVFRNLLVPLLAPSLALTFSLPFRRQDVGIYTTFLIDDSCDKAVVQKAHDDAVKMSGAALDIEHDELSTLLKYTMNWNGAATIDYFGSPQENNAYREHILRTVLLSGSAYRGWGWSDYWNDRYVTVTCNDPANDCGPSSPAYTSNDETRKYPLINYCPTFFQNLTSHDDAWKKIQNGPADLKQNIRNLRSQATTALHELLHVNSHWSSNVCAGGCVDTYQYVNNGQERVPTYKAGRTKLLARRNVQAASMTNDNYAYWVMSRWMEKQTKIYPKYPLAWDPSKSRKDNEDREAKEPGVPDSSAFDIEDSGSGGDNTNVKDDLITADKYPEWYKPILDAMGSDTVSGEINQPTDTTPVPKDAPTDSIECETTDGSPLYFDCVHAFTFNDFRDQPAHKGKRDGNHWEAVSEPHSHSTLPVTNKKKRTVRPNLRHKRPLPIRLDRRL
jgi:hypothetical protein